METLSFYLLTWNVVTMQPPAAEELLTLFKKNADFIAVGLQEVKSQPQNMVSDAITEDSWTNACRDALVAHDYVKIHTIRLVGIILSLYSKRRHITSIKDIETSYTRTGLKGLWGNKGAVTIRFNFKGSSVCVVNCHLTPHDNMVESRIEDYHSVINSQTFNKDKIKSILDHDVIFWIGDLNFRLEPDTFSARQIVDLAATNSFQALLGKDELNQTIATAAAFDEFSECKIDFKPTYKFIPDSQQYDIKRRPAWTDRILYRVFNDLQTADDHVTCHEYRSHSEFMISDHKPVSAAIDVKVKGGALPEVKFETTKSWTVGQSGKITFTLPVSVEHSNWHWIAFFREGFSSFGEYVSYVWVPRYEISGRRKTYEVMVPESSLRIPGKYVAVYMSDKQPYHILGISYPFEVYEEERTNDQQREL